MGNSDPDAYAALDFDDVNLDFLLMTSELPYYNTKDFYTYLNTEFLFNDYNLHSYNTLGALETIAMEQSGGIFDAIKPTCIDGAPRYEFINSTTQGTILPISILYRPVVLSQARFDQIQQSLGKLVVSVQCKDYAKTYGINAYDMNDVESLIYKAKIKLNDNGFEYPIVNVFINVVMQGTYTTEYFAQNILVNESNYAIDGGNLYFKKSIEALVSEAYPKFEDFLAQSWASEMVDDTIFYNIRIEFERFIPDITDETSRLALAQATSYTIMDYFSQYTFAEVSANMIGEIAYTETLTFWSTLISAPLAYFGSWAITSGIGKLAGEAGSKAVAKLLVKQSKSILGGLMGTIVSPVKEVFQEIIEDGFIEAIVGNLVEIAGGSDDLGFWLSSIATSVRESGGALGQLALGGSVNLQNMGTLIQGLATGTSMNDIRQQINQQSQQSQEASQARRDQMSFWSKLLRGGFLKGLYITTSSLFFGSFGFAALSGLSNMVVGVKKASPSSQAILESIQRNRRKKTIAKTIGTQESFSEDSMFYDRVTKPSELDGVNLDLSEDGETTSPFVKILTSINSDPKNIRSKQELVNKFEEFRNNNFFEAIYSKKTQIDTVQTTTKRPKTSDLTVSIAIGDDHEGLFPEFNKDTIHYIHSKLFDPDYDQSKPEGVMEQITYRVDRVQEARDFLRSTTYQGFWILKDGIINPKVYEALQDKFNKGEEFSKLERIIADVASFYMGSMHDGKSMPDGGYNSRLIELYAEETGEKALVNNVPTKSFKDWYNARKTTKGGAIQYTSFRNQKMGLLTEIVHDQLQHYSKTGERLISLEEASKKIGCSIKSGRKYTKIILGDTFKDPKTVQLIYSMIFGMVSVSYQKVNRKAIEKGLIITTSSAEWFKMMKERGDTQPNHLFVDYQCAEKGHKYSMRINSIVGCYECGIAKGQFQPLDFHKILEIASEHNLQPISYFDDSKQLTEDEFNNLKEKYNSQNQDPEDYKYRSYIYMVLKWKCLDCSHTFEVSYMNIQHSKINKYCPKCVSSIDQQRTLEVTEDLFQDYTIQSFRSNLQLTRFLPNRILLMNKYQVISDPRVHVDCFGVINVKGKEFKIAIEHQGPQHYSFSSFLDIVQKRDIANGIYKTIEEYKSMFDAQIERDRAKVELFKDLNKDGYYLIVVPYRIPKSKRSAFILSQFIRQTGVNPDHQPGIADFL